MALRYLFLGLLAACSLPAAEAQITLTVDDYPLQPGTSPYASFSTDNEDGANTAAIETIIAQTGPDQTYDFTTITYENTLGGTITVEAGATGPGAELEPLSEATRTATYPFVFSDGETSAEGTLFFYLGLTDEASYTFGTVFQGDLDGQDVEVTTSYTPDGRQDSAFPLIPGSMWSSNYTQLVSFNGFKIVSGGSDSYEVEGWGTLVAPGFEEGVPALRVKLTTEITTNGVTTTSVCHEFRSTVPVEAVVCEGDDAFDEPATASVASTGSVSTSEEPAVAVGTSALGPAYPNPARDVVTIEYEVAQRGPVELVVYDVLGRSVRRLVAGSHAAGAHVETVDVTGLPPGLYLARLTTGEGQWVRPLRVVR